MSVEYDPDLEGTEIPTLVSEKPVRFRQKYDELTQRYITYNLKCVKSFQPIEYDLEGPDGEEKFNAFIKTLEVIHKWMNADKAYVKYGDKVAVWAERISNKMKTHRGLVWIMDEDNVKRYFTLSYLSRINWTSLISLLTNLLQTFLNDYSGFNASSLVHNINSTSNSSNEEQKLYGSTIFQMVNM